MLGLGEFESIDETSMSAETQLREKLRKIEALFAGAGTAGERLAAGAALERVKARLAELGQRDSAIEVQYSMPDQWSRQLFMALCRRYGLKPFRYRRQRHNTVMLRVPQGFSESVLWPEFTQLNHALRTYLNEVTLRVIHEEIHSDASEAQEVPDALLPAS
jgi:hypothetical protein